MRRPDASQNAGSSGRQSSSAPFITVLPGMWIDSISGSSGSWSSAVPWRARSMERIAMCIQPSETATITNRSAKQLV